MKSMIRTYSELAMFDTFIERFEYLNLQGIVAEETFGHERYLNQIFYQSEQWLDARDKVIERDLGCDLGIEGHEIFDMVIVHHMNPITPQDILDGNPDIYNPEYLIVVSKKTHKAIHYGTALQLEVGPVIRTPNDTIPWKN